MGLIKCKDCEKEVSSIAVKCPNCGRPIKKRRAGYLLPILFGLVIIIFFAAFFISDFTSEISASNTLEEARVIPPKRQRGELELLYLRGYKSSIRHITVEGEVRNITGKHLENIQAVVRWYDTDGNLITSDDTLVAYNPILPNQISSFDVISRYNPAMKRYKVSFRPLLGKTIKFRDVRK